MTAPERRARLRMKGTHMGESRLTRRQSLLRFAGLAAATGAGAAWELPGSGSAAVEHGLVQCVFTPELTEGPYYVAGENVRHDVTEGKAGTPMLLSLRVLNAAT